MKFSGNGTVTEILIQRDKERKRNGDREKEIEKKGTRSLYLCMNTYISRLILTNHFDFFFTPPPFKMLHSYNYLAC